MPWTEGKGVHGPTLWRVMIILTMLAVAVLGFVMVGLFNDSNKALQRGKELGCRIGGFLVDAPIVQTPGVSDKEFQTQLERSIDFLTSLKALNCEGLGHVTTAKINEQVRKINQQQKGVVKHAGNSPPGQQPGGSGPPTQKPPPEPPTQTTTGPIQGTLHTVCHVNALGVRVCIKVDQ